MNPFPNRKTLPAAELQQLAGSFEAVSDWIRITQEMIDGFAAITRDHQFIHVDPARAKAETPFGGTIAHGFLTLSMLSAFAIDCLPIASETAIAINYGFDKVRFLNPVPSGARIRGRFKLMDYSQRKPGEMQGRYAVSVEIEGSDKPALAADWLGVTILKPSKDGKTA
jgi:acyl dehydratase